MTANTRESGRENPMWSTSLTRSSLAIDVPRSSRLFAPFAVHVFRSRFTRTAPFVRRRAGYFPGATSNHAKSA
ncbi:hypothetical protein DB354_12270 [Opitutus sp. ER46]|nr:hypothetical protein DB354_12270 [Opitutus sp. ER46]